MRKQSIPGLFLIGLLYEAIPNAADIIKILICSQAKFRRCKKRDFNAAHEAKVSHSDVPVKGFNGFTCQLITTDRYSKEYYGWKTNILYSVY